MDQEKLSAILDRGKISAIMPTTPKKMATKADLAFVDAAIQLQRAALGQIAEGPTVGATSPEACDIVDVAAAVVAVAVLAYHLYNSCMVGEDLSALQLVNRLNVAPNVSLENLIAARNRLAGSLGVGEL